MDYLCHAVWTCCVDMLCAQKSQFIDSFGNLQLELGKVSTLIDTVL